MSILFVTGFIFALRIKGAGGMGKIVFRTEVFLLIYFLSLLFSVSLVFQCGCGVEKACISQKPEI